MNSNNISKYQSHSFNLIIDREACNVILSSTTYTQKQQIYHIKKLFRNIISLLNSTIISYFILVCCIHPDSGEFGQIYESCLLPALSQSRDVIWSIDAHTAYANNYNEDDSDTSSVNEGVRIMKGDSPPTVYIIKSSPRRSTRSLTNGDTYPAVMKLHTYDTSSIDSDSGDNMMCICQPCIK